ncbi:hypothetical protein [Planomonospora parontospora]|uniref:hypothetical protein n=1 Tax=Planomonospora parontospora TaxID=58119 RepID=UPI0016704AA1|nr:hypothetical protein [Planomonospora parontospora]
MPSVHPPWSASERALVNNESASCRPWNACAFARVSVAAAMPGTFPSSSAAVTAACAHESQSLMLPLAQKWLRIASARSQAARRGPDRAAWWTAATRLRCSAASHFDAEAGSANEAGVTPSDVAPGGSLTQWGWLCSTAARTLSRYQS